jgi:hypothetical protein
MHCYHVFSIFFFENVIFEDLFIIFLHYFMLYFFCLETSFCFDVPTIFFNIHFIHISFLMDNIFSFWLESICQKNIAKKLRKMGIQLYPFFSLSKKM